MNEDVRWLWIDALRSGKYAQRRFYMSTFDGREGFWRHCPLGILCELAVQEGIVDYEDQKISFSDKRKNDYLLIRAYGAEKAEILLPREVLEWAELKTADSPYLSYENSFNTVSSLNDSGEHTFEDIAEMLEKSTLII